MRSIIAIVFLFTLFTCTPVVKEYKQLKTRESGTVYKTGKQPVYKGDSLRHILFPVGGIGTGNILMGGRGEIREWEIFGRANLDELPPDMTFFGLWMKENKIQEGVPVEKKPVIKILEGRLRDDFPNPFGVPRQQLSGMPRFSQVEFRGEYPFAWYDFSDPDVPLEIRLEVFNPFIPLDVENSSLPAAIFHWNISNTSKHPIDISVLFSISNPFSQERRDDMTTCRGERAEAINVSGFKGITLSSSKTNERSLDDENITVISMPGAGIQTWAYRGGWWDNAHMFLKDFSDDGKLEVKTEKTVNPGRKPDVSFLWIHDTIQPGDSVVIPFIITWFVPERIAESSMAFDNYEARNAVIQNEYATRFNNSAEVAEYIISKRDYLYNSTMKYHDILFSSSFPSYVIDALASNTAGLKTNLLMRNHLGQVHGFEGLGNDFGCCPGNCTHVWNYAQSMAFLFPSLEKEVRTISFMHDTHSNGYQCFRSTFPLGNYWFKNVAADGQMGNIMRVYREWKMSGDSIWLSTLWPKVKAALEFAWEGSGTDLKPGSEWQSHYTIPWDPDKEGVMRGNQHNTYDINFFGPNTMTGSLYLGALKACAEMADYMGDIKKSAEYSDLYLKGKDLYEDLCWNGEYFIQKTEVIPGVIIPDHLKSVPDQNGDILPKYQYGNGCLSDQLLGQFLAHVSGLGYIFDSAKVNQAMNAIYTYNYKPDLSHFQNVQRTYALNHEGGLVTCTWPHGDRPVFPFVYADEIWTGIEYQVAASLIWSGFVDQGLNVVQAVRNRYKGYNRNPFAEIESGRFYARAMSSWALILALSGFHYDGARDVMTFAPAINHDDFNTFWSCGDAWGEFSIKDNMLSLIVRHGSLKIKRLNIPDSYSYKAILHAEPERIDLMVANGMLMLQFQDHFIVSKNQKIEIEFE